MNYQIIKDEQKLKEFIKYYQTLLVICCIATIPISYLFYDVDDSSPSEKSAKEYIMEHRSDITKTNAACFKLDTVYNSYYTDATIQIRFDSTYHVIFWGNRNSWLWRFKKDLNFTIDIPYQRFKGNDVSQDVIIYSILKNK